MLCNFIEITCRYVCSPINFMHIFRTPNIKTPIKARFCEVFKKRMNKNKSENKFPEDIYSNEYFLQWSIIKILRSQLQLKSSCSNNSSILKPWIFWFLPWCSTSESSLTLQRLLLIPVGYKTNFLATINHKNLLKSDLLSKDSI